jgi:membrane protein
VSQVKERATKITRRPVIAHLIRCIQRYNERLGNQFGAAITYFSVLAIVPIIMFAFSVLGFFVVEVTPDLMDNTTNAVRSAVSELDSGTQKEIVGLVSNVLHNYAAIGIVGLLSALYAGAGWMGNLKDAVRAQWRPSFDVQVKKENFIIKTLSNIAILIGLLIMIGATFALASISTSLSGNIVGWLGLSQLGWLRPVLQFVPVLFSIGAGWLVFMYLYLVLPETREPWSAVRRGSLIGAVGLGILQYLTSFLIGRFTHSQSAGLFGPVIALMLFFNLFARLILLVAAWIGTAEHPAEPEEARMAEQQGEHLPVDGSAGGRGEAGGDRRPDGRAQPRPIGATLGQVRAEREADGWFPATGDGADPRGAWSSTPGLVREKVAVQSVKVGVRTGYLTGAATGAGLGAALAYLMDRRRIRRSSRAETRAARRR